MEKGPILHVPDEPAAEAEGTKCHTCDFRHPNADWAFVPYHCNFCKASVKICGRCFNRRVVAYCDEECREADAARREVQLAEFSVQGVSTQYDMEGNPVSTWVKSKP